MRKRTLSPVVRPRSWASLHLELVHPEVVGRKRGGIKVEHRLLAIAPRRRRHGRHRRNAFPSVGLSLIRMRERGRGKERESG